MRTADEVKLAWTVADVRACLPDAVPRVRLPWLYRAGLLAVAISLVALQAIYLAMVALAAYLTFLYAVQIPTVIASVRLNALTIVLVATPLAAGVIATFFLLKPLLAKPAAKAEPLPLDPEANPLLFAFVDKLCKALRAPAPARIDIDLQVNASARLRRGWRSLFAHDLVLTIGLPLAGGLSVRQFAGVLAHEFGHFAQSAGMRLHYLIGTIQLWFARVAYERDDWDAMLERWREGGDWRVRIVLAIAHAAVFASRAILRALLYVANIISAWFSRQMEFDADRHEAALVGGDVFAATSSQLVTLSVAANAAWSTADRTWQRRLLPDDLVVLVADRYAALDEGTRAAVLEASMSEPTGRWATHPCTRDRVARVSEETGLLPEVEPLLDAPAGCLFADFAALCRRATADLYTRTFGEAAGQANLMPALEYVASTAAEHRRAGAMAQVFGGLNQPSRWFRLPDSQPEADTPELQLPVEDETAKYWALLEDLLHQHAGVEILRLGGRLRPGAFHLFSAELKPAEAELETTRSALDAEIDALRARYRDFGYVLRQDEALTKAYSALSAEQGSLLDLRLELTALRVVADNTDAVGVRASAYCDRAVPRVRQMCDAIRSRLAAVPYPLAEPADPSRSIADELLAGIDASALTAEQLAGHILARADTLSDELLGAMCANLACSGSAGSDPGQ